jgi:hypothetical protein
LCRPSADARAQEIDFDQINKFESVGKGTLTVGEPPKTIVDDNERRVVILTIWDADAETKVYWKPSDAEKPVSIFPEHALKARFEVTFSAKLFCCRRLDGVCRSASSPATSANTGRGWNIHRQIKLMCVGDVTFVTPPRCLQVLMGDSAAETERCVERMCAVWCPYDCPGMG